MFSSLRSRLLLTYLIVIAVALGVVAAVTLVYLARNPAQVAQTRTRLQIAADAVISRAPGLKDSPSLARERILQRVDQGFDVRLLLLSAQGEVLLDTREQSAPALASGDAASVLLRQGRVFTLRDASGEEWLALTRQLSPEFWLLVAAPRPRLTLLEAVRSRSDEVVSFLRLGGLAALALSLILALGMSRWVANPLQRLADAAADLPRGAYRPQEPRGPAEVQTLTRAFNQMASQVQSSRQSQRDFVANVSHELKTPLTSIQGFAQAIMDGTAARPRDAARVIADEAARMHRLVLDLLDLARLDAGTFEFSRSPVDLTAVLRGVAARLSPQAAQAQVNLNLQVEDLPVLIGDGDRLAQVFTNLVDNAIKHTPPGGDVQVTARLQGGQAVIAVRDRGEGIPPEELTRIFERFYRVDKSRAGGKHRGTGLGLAIARQFVEAHGGTIRAQSAPGQGSVFVVKLPLAFASDETLAERRS